MAPLLEHNLAASYKNASWDKIPDGFKDKDGRWASSYWGAISFLINTDKVKEQPATWNDLLKPAYKDMVCSRDPRVSTYATAFVLAAAYANSGGEGNVQPGLDWFKKAPSQRQFTPGRRAKRGIGAKRRVPDFASL